MTTLVVASLSLVALLLAGAAIDLLVRPNPLSPPVAPLSRIADGVALFVPVLLFAALVLGRLGALNRVVLAVPVGVIFLAGAFSFSRSSYWSGIRPIGGFAAAITFGLGVWVRRDPVYFLGQWTDFGEYVNRGNAIADGGPPGGYFPPLTEAVVAVGHQFFGQSNAVEIFPVLGVITGGFIAAVVMLLTKSNVAAAGAALLFAVHPTAAWFGRLPTSEAVYAALLIMLVYQVVRAPANPLGPVSTMATVAAMVATRPNGLIDVIPFAAACLVAALAKEGETLRRMIAPVTGGWMVGYLWLANFGYLRGVFVSASNVLGSDSGVLAERAAQPASQFIIILVVAACAWVLASLSRWVEQALSPVASQWVPQLIVASVGIVLVMIIASGQLSIVRDGLRSAGWILVCLAGAGGVIAAFARGWSRGGTAFITALSAMWLFVYSQQFAEPLPHYVFLYWERYLYPTVIVMAFVFAGATLAFIAESTPLPPWANLASGVVACVTAGLLWLSPTNELQHLKQYHGEDFYQNLNAIADDIPDDAIVTYEGVGEEEIWNRYYFFFPNTFRIVGSPLIDTFGIQFNNLNAAASGPDPLPIEDGATHRLRVQIEPNDEPVDPGAHVVPISLLPRDSTSRSDWISAVLTVSIEEIPL